MSYAVPRTEEEIAALYRAHSRTVYRVCYAYMKNTADTEDAVQETFIRLIRSCPSFESAEHEKAWLIRTASNICKNMLRHWWRKRENIEDYETAQPSGNDRADEVMAAIMALPDKYKTPVYLYYYEGYSGDEIAAILKKPSSTVRNYLREARLRLRTALGEDPNEE